MNLYLAVAHYETMRSTHMTVMVTRHLYCTKTISSFLPSVLTSTHKKDWLNCDWMYVVSTQIISK